jgi:hypothetical protein
MNRLYRIARAILEMAVLIGGLASIVALLVVLTA